MKSIRAIARYTLIQHVRSRVFMVILIFGLLLLLSGIIFSGLAMEQRQRVFIDLGFAAIELLALMIILFSSSSIILEEMESRTLYLVLTRPVHRMTYVIGRFSGMVLSVASAMVIMGILNVLFLLLFGVPVSSSYIIQLLLSFLKVLLAGSMGLFFSVFSSSNILAMSFTIFMWILGHFSIELHYIIQNAGSAVMKNLMTLLYYAVPNLNLLEFRDLSGLAVMPDISWLMIVFGYSAIYMAGCLILSYMVFMWKEF